jgi:hypothetical protein
MSFYNTPRLHHSSTPKSRDSKTLGNLGFAFFELIPPSFDSIVDALSYLIVTKIGPHARTRGRHGMPVCAIHQDTFNKGPSSTHARLNRMNRTQLIPEYTITVFCLGNKRFASGHLAVALYKSFAIQSQIPTDILDLRLGDIGAAISFTALPAILAGKQILRRNLIRGHGESPWLFSV